jgi:hypothetical protein
MALSKMEKYVVDTMMQSNNSKEEIAKMLTRSDDDAEFNRYYNSKHKKIKTMFINKTIGNKPGIGIMTQAQSMNIDEAKNNKNPQVEQPPHIFKIKED